METESSELNELEYDPSKLQSLVVDPIGSREYFLETYVFKTASELSHDLFADDSVDSYFASRLRKKPILIKMIMRAEKMRRHGWRRK